MSAYFSLCAIDFAQGLYYNKAMKDKRQRITGKRISGKRISGALFIAVLLVAVIVWNKTGAGEKTADVVPLPELIIGSDDYEPYNYIDPDGNPAGIDVEIAEELCKRLRVKPVFKQVPWEQKDMYLKKQTVDCLWGCFTMSGREDQYEWAGPYMYSREVAAVSKESGIHSLADLAGKRIAVQATTIPEQILITGVDDRISQVQCVYSLSTMEELYASLRKGYVDAIMGHESALGTFVSTNSGQFEILPESLYDSSLGVAFEKNTHAELAKRMTQEFEKMKADGTIGAIAEKYGLDIHASVGDTEQ